MPTLRDPGSALDARGDKRNALLAPLIRQAAGGDMRAFTSLYDATSTWLLGRVRSIVGDSYAEDVLTEVYLQVWRSLPEFDGQRGEPLGWLSTIARSRALDRLRHERSRSGSHPHLDTELAAAELGHDAGPEAEYAHRQSCAALQASIQHLLSAKEKLVVGLAYFRECSHTEISALTGMPVGTVKTLLHRSHRKLRAQMVPAMTTGTSQGDAVG